MDNDFSGSVPGFDVDPDIVNGIEQINQGLANNRRAEVVRQSKQQVIKIAIPFILGLGAVILIVKYVSDRK